MGLTQRETAERLSMSRSSVQDFERGARLQAPHAIPEESWERLKAMCLSLQTGLYMTDAFKVVGLLPAARSRKSRALAKSAGVALATKARR